MSGSWVQRGEPAIIEKYARARMAIAGGCDLVLELPAPWSMSGAQFFARAGVHIADCIGADALAFGSESGETSPLLETAERLAAPEFSAAMKNSREAHPEWSAAKLRERVYAELYGETPHFSGSNDILALEYLRAIRDLGASLEPVAIRRVGGAYRSAELSEICSATAIRSAIFSGTAQLSPYMPEAAADIFAPYIAAGRYHHLSMLDTAAAVTLSRDSSELSGIMELSGGMEHRLCASARHYDTIAEIIAASRDSRYSDSRLRRAIVSAMLGFKMSDADALPRFTNVLAANEKGREALAKNRGNERIAILAKPKLAAKLTGAAIDQYAANRRAERLYELTRVKFS